MRLMSRVHKLIWLLGALFILTTHATVFAEAPYYTYTSDKQGYTIKTQTAYTPSQQISVINGERLAMPEHVFVDELDFVYIADSTHNKVYILDDKYGYHDELSSDKFTFIKSTFVTADMIYVVDSFESKVFIFDKITHEFINEISQPNAPIFNEGYHFRPTHIAVDIRGNIYVRSNSSVNGLIMLNRDGEFITFFGANPLKVPLLDQIRSLFLTKVQQEKIEKVFPDVPSNIAIDKKGFIYTVTSSIETNPIKKFNVSGTNYFSDDLVAHYSMESVWVSRHNTIYAVSSDGWIYEYDSGGNLLFLFGGKDFSSSRLGLLNRPISIASNSVDELIVIDQGLQLIQTYESTQFSNAVHQAMDAYQAGDYTESKELWEYTLKYNAIFDNAHVGLGDAYLREGDAQGAYDEYYDAQYKEGISEAFWEIRQLWLRDNLNIVFVIIIVSLVLYYTYKIINRKRHYNVRFAEWMANLRKIKIIDHLLYIFTFLKHPLNGIYEIQDENRVSKKASTIMYVIGVIIFILHHKYTSILFVPKNEYIIYELLIIVMLFILWVISNYLICSISDGEGSFTDVYNGTAYALSPILVIMPPVILLSNFLTLEQSVFYHLPMQGMFIWTAILMFFTIKDMHNYEVGETFGIIFKSLFAMLIIGLFLFVVYSLGNQLLGFVYDVITEVSSRW